MYISTPQSKNGVKAHQSPIKRRSTVDSDETACPDDVLVTVMSFYFYAEKVNDIEALKVVLKTMYVPAPEAALIFKTIFILFYSEQISYDSRKIHSLANVTHVEIVIVLMMKRRH